MLSASGGGVRLPDQGLCPWTPLGALPPDPRYRLVLRTRHGAPQPLTPSAAYALRSVIEYGLSSPFYPILALVCIGDAVVRGLIFRKYVSGEILNFAATHTCARGVSFAGSL